MNVASKVAHTLMASGIRRAYGLPGEDHLWLLDAFAKAGITYHTAYNESSAAIMAATDAAISGSPGVVLLSLAPGISNGMNGLLHAYLEELPLVVFSGQHRAARLPFVVRQGFDLDSLLAPVTKWRGRIAAGTDAALAVCKALDIATAGRPGPVYLELPDEVSSAEEADETVGVVDVLRAQWADRGLTRAAGSPPTERSLRTLRDLLAEAERPALIVGGRQAAVSGATLSEFAGTFGCPLLTTSGQKGLLGGDEPYYAGTFLNGSLEAGLLDRCDLIILVNPEGYDIYNTPWPYRCTTVAISGSPLTEWLQPFDARIVADPEATLQALLKQADRAPAWQPAEIAGYRAGVRAALLSGHGLTVPHAIDAALSAAPRDVRIIADAGFGKPPLAMLSEPAEPGCYLASNALSTMGFAIPAALASIRCSGRPVLAFVGDGSLLMRATELLAAEPSPVPLVVVGLMDRSLSQIEIKQERRQLAEVGVRLPDVSCVQMGTALGIDGVDVDTVEELSEAVAGGWRSGRPLLVGAQVETAASRKIFEVLRG